MTSNLDKDQDQLTPLDVAHVSEFLASLLGRQVSGVEPVGQGEWSAAFAFRWRENDLVVRFSERREDFEKDRWASRFNGAHLPIPRIIEIGDAFGGFFAISDRARGRYLDHLDGAELRTHLPALFATLDAARNLDLTDTTGYGTWGLDNKGVFSSWSEALLAVGRDSPHDRTAGWRERLLSSPAGAATFERGYRYLEESVAACPAERHLIHADLLNFNVLVEGGKISALLDWGSGMYGDFLYDVAWFAYWAPWYPQWQGIDFKREAARHYAAIGLAVPSMDERIRCYEIHIGLAGLAYRAFKGDWAEVEARGNRVLAIAEGSNRQ